nr:hypothetical protein [uncultured Acetatifactor sp.]
MQQGVADEYNLLLAPSADGELTAPTVFDKFEFLAAATLIEY